jgi:hypothetical protein
MSRHNLAPLALKANDDAETRSILLRAQRLLAKGERAQALQYLKSAADLALARNDDRRAVKLAAAAAELRATGELDPARADAASAVMPVGARAHSPAPPRHARRDRPPPIPSAAPKSASSSEARDRTRKPNESRDAPEIIDVDAGWLEAVKRDGSDRPAEATRTDAGEAALGEAVRVWVGPTGEISVFKPGTRLPKDHVEALLVTHVTTAGLAARLRRGRA